MNKDLIGEKGFPVAQINLCPLSPIHHPQYQGDVVNIGAYQRNREKQATDKETQTVDPQRRYRRSNPKFDTNNQAMHGISAVSCRLKYSKRTW